LHRAYKHLTYTAVVFLGQCMQEVLLTPFDTVNDLGRQIIRPTDVGIGDNRVPENISFQLNTTDIPSLKTDRLYLLILTGKLFSSFVKTDFLMSI
jgi:hypothetical protein